MRIALHSDMIIRPQTEWMCYFMCTWKIYENIVLDEILQRCTDESTRSVATLSKSHTIRAYIEIKKTLFPAGNFIKSLTICSIFSLSLSLFLYFLQLAGSGGTEYHFKHNVLQHARTRRSILHTRALKREPLVSDMYNVHAVECEWWPNSMLYLYAKEICVNSNSIVVDCMRQSATYT